jgi:hypothetical protein
MAFVSRQIALSIKLAPKTNTNQPSTFVESGTDTVNISGLRTSVQVENSGAVVGSTARIKIWGMPPSLMNQLATLGLVFNLVPKNVLTIQAGDVGQASLTSIFLGTIYSAYGDYSAQPDVPFIFECLAGAAEAVAPATASTFQGATSVADIMSGFARQMGLTFENNGVTAKLSRSYFSGSLREQADAAARDAGISWGVIGNTLAIWPKGGNRNTPNIPTISPSSEMISYPAFTQQGIVVKTVFNPQISFGSLIKVQSSLLSAIASAQSGATPFGGSSTFPSQWAVNKLDHFLDANLPKGQWMSVIYAYNPNYARGIIPPNSGTGL